MTRISLFLPDPQLAALRAVAESLDLPLAEVIRRALDAYLAKNKRARVTPTD